MGREWTKRSRIVRRRRKGVGNEEVGGNKEKEGRRNDKEKKMRGSV